MSLVSDALKKAQAQTALRGKGIRVDLTGAGGGSASRATAPVLAALAVAVAVGVVTIGVVVVLLRSNDPPGREHLFAGAGTGAVPPRGTSPSDPSPNVAVQPRAGGVGEPEREPSDAGDPPPPSPQAVTERSEVAGSTEHENASIPGAQAVLDPSKLNAVAAIEPTPPGPAPEPEPKREAEPERPRPPLEEGGEYVEVLYVAGLPELKLTGIAWSDFAKIALVNGMSVEPGDLIHGIRVKAVEPQRVHFRAPDGRTFYLRMR